MIILSWDIGKSKRNIIELQKKCLDAQILEEIERMRDTLPDGVIVRKPINSVLFSASKIVNFTRG